MGGNSSMYQLVLCPRCGELFKIPPENKFPVCRICEYDDLIIEPITNTEYNKIYQTPNYTQSVSDELDESLREQYVYTNPAFDKIWYNRRLSKTQQAESEPSASSQVRCPQCGSTSIQAVQRKWSMMTGLLTNKVDRVCLNCKNKF